MYLFLLVALALFTLSHACPPPLRNRCRYGDSCWPSDQQWQAFNESISGRLIQTVPSAAVCHGSNYDADGCEEAKTQWANSFWRTNQTGAYTAIVWELGNDQCFINSSRTDPCEPGLVPHFSVGAKSPADIQAAVKFASQNDLYLVVKNTGHDHLGRSSGQGSLSIWTHNMKGTNFTDTFVPKSAPGGTEAITAVTLQAGEQWLDVYRAAAEAGVIVVGGQARTVGAAGGYLTGGGHSAWANLHGLAVDNLVEVNLVNAKGDHITVNQYTDPDYFYALRGGGGSAWGVITSVTYKTYPEPSHIQVGAISLNSTEPSSLRPVLEQSIKALVNITDAGYTGYGYLGGGFQGIFVRPGGMPEEFLKGIAAFARIGEMNGTSFAAFNFTYPRWIDFCNDFLQDPNIAKNVMDASRLLTSDLALNKAEKIVDMMEEFGPAYTPFFNFIGKANPAERNKTSVHPAWHDSRAVMSFGTDWNDTASAQEKRELRSLLVKMSERWQEIAGPEGGAYINEANPYEPKWQQTFWGANYDRLLKIKRRIDPSNLFVCNRCVGSDLVYEAETGF